MVDKILIQMDGGSFNLIPDVSLGDMLLATIGILGLVVIILKWIDERFWR